MTDPIDRFPSHKTLTGRLLRMPLRLIPRGKVLPILGGPCAGMKWVFGAGPASNWLGISEIAKHRLVERIVARGSTFVDAGANAGIYTMQAARLCGPEGCVVAIEPSPVNVAALERHVRLNALDNVTVIAGALSDQDGLARFCATNDRVTSHLSEAGELVVECHRLDTLVRSGRIRLPGCIKIDVEGAEAAVLRGASQVLGGHLGPPPTVLLATHGPALRHECEAILRNHGYVLQSIAELADEFVARHSNS